MCCNYTQNVYTAHMEEMRKCWVCDVCGFAWLVTGEAPSHCASSKCRSRKWNKGEASANNQGGIDVPVLRGKDSMEGNSARTNRGRKVSGTTVDRQRGESPVNLADRVQGRLARKTSGLIAGSGVVVAGTQKPAAPAKNRSLTERCPHDYQNWMVCRNAGGGCV